jgi:hypothetical protein
MIHDGTLNELEGVPRMPFFQLGIKMLRIGQDMGDKRFFNVNDPSVCSDRRCEVAHWCEGC